MFLSHVAEEMFLPLCTSLSCCMLDQTHVLHVCQCLRTCEAPKVFYPPQFVFVPCEVQSDLEQFLSLPGRGCQPGGVRMSVCAGVQVCVCMCFI